MSPNARERAYEKRRYEEWQARRTAKIEAQNKRRRRLLVVGAALAVVAIAAGAFAFLRGDGEETPAAGPTAAPTPAAEGACPAVTVKPPEKPKTFEKPAATGAGGRTWTMTMKTTCGDIGLTLDGKAAPQAVSSMLLLGREGFFDGTPCHRLTTEGIHVLQCGDPTGTGSGGPGFEYGPVENAPKDDVYPAGTIAMARQGGNGNSMGSQFFLVYKDSTIPSDAAGGYTVLGKITSGLDVVTKVADAGVAGGASDGQPAAAVSITGTTVAAG